MRRRRIWSELLPLSEVGSPPVLRLLARHGLELSIAVRPETLPDLPRLCRAAATADVPVAVWPMIADHAGRWASAPNASEFRAFIDELLARLTEEVVPPREVILDLEPPMPLVQRALSGPRGLVSLLRGSAATWSPPPPHLSHPPDLSHPPHPLPPPDAAPHTLYRALVDHLIARDIHPTAAIVPLLLRDGPTRSWERVLATPLSGIGYRSIHAMLYTSMLEGWSRGLLRRLDALSLLAALCRDARTRFGDAAGASLGVVGTGALGDEPTYGDVDELRQDVATARASGIDDLALFDLGGVLTRSPPERWLRAFVTTPAAQGPPLSLTPRARRALTTLDLIASYCVP
ncbi:hypothetical protein [Chondromyces apiculatus]|uniref:Uncharacterized protein n=1 Tax=Chondromyces apiculatus DSM 436 TaxID=1192034 RepID=A0A017T7V9_9BACT|nr:hypothetical protein [Chondromyces apiculatus]EYF05329.1 Hypothetical protein CAP_3470 [Chondromyces apiculatus DSM 436]